MPIVYILVGAACIVGGVVFIVGRERISAIALRRGDDPYKDPKMLSPMAMLIGGAVLAIAGVCFVLAGLFPTA